MPSIQIMPYHVRVRAYRDPDMIYALNDLPGGYRLTGLLGDYLHTRKSQPFQDTEAHRLLSVDHISQTPPLVSGVLLTGDYGYEADLVNFETMTPAYHRTVEDAELIPFYFMADLSTDGQQGVLLLQRFGVFGAKTVFCQDFEQFISSYFSDSDKVVLEINPILDANLASQWLERGRVVNIALVRQELPSDVADYLDSSNLPHPEIKEAQLSLQIKRNSGFTRIWKEKINNVLVGRSNVKEIIEVPSFEPDTVRVEIVIDGARRVIDLVNSARIRAYYNVTDEVDLGPNGHPVFTSIDAIAIGIIQSLSKGK